MKTIYDQFRKYIVATVLKLSGFRAWLVNIFLKYILKKVEEYFKKLEISKEETQKGEQAKKDYENVINDPTKPVDEKHKAIDDLFNR